MQTIIGVKFKTAGKIYYFAPGKQNYKTGDRVVVETSRGTECGTVIFGNRQVEDSQISDPLKTVKTKASQKDLQRLEQNKSLEREAFSICAGKIHRHQLPMKLIDVEYTFDRRKILFYFTADGRIDFRDLVKDLAAVFRTRIELRQIGVRDEAKMIGGLGICGRPFCCSTFLSDFHPVSIKMAKEQGLSLNPTKISGTCGRLLCCLKYEQDVYESLMRITPRVGARVLLEKEVGVVTESNLMTGMLKVRVDGNEEGAFRVVHRKEVRPVRDGLSKGGKSPGKGKKASGTKKAGEESRF